MDFKFSDLKELFIEWDMSRSEVEEFVENVMDGEDDFTVGNYRYINEDAIDRIMQEELSGDEWMLGNFNAWFLADVLDIDCDVIEEMQKCEAYGAIGKLVMSMNKLEELQEKYASADGYGHHFNHWDGSEEMISFNGDIPSFYMFKESGSHG